MPDCDAEITATYTDLPRYTLTVNSGTGSGDYWAGFVVNITADPAPSGQVFFEWVGDVSTLVDVRAPDTTLSMPAQGSEVTASYTETYMLTVNSGTGSGVYGEGRILTIYSDPPGPEKVF